MVKVEFTKLFINNEWVDAKSGKTFPTSNPSNKQLITHVAEADKEDVGTAVAAAKAAFHRDGLWRTMDASDRGILIMKLADKMEEHLDHIASLDALDMGKPINDAIFDVQESIKMFRYFAGYADKFTGKVMPKNSNQFDKGCPNFGYTLRQPVGIVGQIIPWNYPTLMLSMKLAPALSMGNVVVMKQAEDSPLSALFIASLIKEAGFPPGVVNFVPGYGATAGAAITSHPDIRKIAFTGSTAVGKLIYKAGADTCKRVTLELGGKNPVIVFPDANLEVACGVSHAALFTNSGQMCIAGSRTFVHESVYDKFVQLSVYMASGKVLGDPLNAATTQGPMVNEAQYNKVLDLIESGKQEGAKLECGGAVAAAEGYFIKPTIFSNVTDDMRIAKEEIFGPVQCIFKFRKIQEVIDRANDTKYGLAASIFSNSVHVIHEVADGLEAGNIWVNNWAEIHAFSAFGGYKESGLGRECGEAVLHGYTEEKTVMMTRQRNPALL